MAKKTKVKKPLVKRMAGAVESAIGFLAPGWSLRRAVCNYTKKNLFKSYRGAENSRLKADWNPGSGSADDDLVPDLPDLRDRSRDLNRNDATASGITQTITVNTVGTGIRPQSIIDYNILGISEEQADTIRKQQETVFAKWNPYADAGNRMNFYEIQALADRQILENGESIIIIRRIKDRPFLLALEVVEGDRLSTPTDLKSNKNIKSGVEVGPNGEPVAYYIRKSHPGDMWSQFNSNASDYMRIEAFNEFGMPNILHLYVVQRPGQTRGIPFFAPVMSLFKDLGDYLEAEVVATRISACFALFVKTTDPYNTAIGSASGSNASSQRLEDIEPGMIQYLGPGQEVTPVNPTRPGTMFDSFVERIIRMIGSALQLPYELVAKDFSKTNYSSARAGLLQAQKYFKSRQRWLAERLCQPVWNMVQEEAYLKNQLPISNFYEREMDWTLVRWITPGWQWVDPLKEVKAVELALENNLTSLADEVAQKGQDWETVMEQNARERKKREDLGLPDPSISKSQTQSITVETEEE